MERDALLGSPKQVPQDPAHLLLRVGGNDEGGDGWRLRVPSLFRRAQDGSQLLRYGADVPIGRDSLSVAQPAGPISTASNAVARPAGIKWYMSRFMLSIPV